MLLRMYPPTQINHTYSFFQAWWKRGSSFRHHYGALSAQIHVLHCRESQKDHRFSSNTWLMSCFWAETSQGPSRLQSRCCFTLLRPFERTKRGWNFRLWWKYKGCGGGYVSVYPMKHEIFFCWLFLLLLLWWLFLWFCQTVMRWWC